MLSRVDWSGVRAYLAVRPLIGPIVANGINRRKPQPKHFYVVKHPTFPMFLRDPYAMGKSAGDPRYDWCSFQRAFVFTSEAQAQYVCEWAGIDAVFVKVARRSVRRRRLRR